MIYSCVSGEPPDALFQPNAYSEQKPKKPALWLRAWAVENLAVS